jgi:hypothetical protein
MIFISSSRSIVYLALRHADLIVWDAVEGIEEYSDDKENKENDAAAAAEEDHEVDNDDINDQ